MTKNFNSSVAAALLALSSSASALEFIIPSDSSLPHAKVSPAKSGERLCSTWREPNTCNLVEGERYKIHRWTQNWAAGTVKKFTAGKPLPDSPAFDSSGSVAMDGEEIPDKDGFAHAKVTPRNSGQLICRTWREPRICNLQEGETYKIHRWTKNWSFGFVASFVAEVGQEPEPAPEPAPDPDPEPTPGAGEYDSALPMGGLFYGNHQSGLHTGNAQIGIENSRRFRAEKTGNVTAVGYHNRIIVPSELGRWSSCSGLDEYECGYTLNNHYVVGNGGSIHVEIRRDNNGVPSSQSLGRTAGQFVPMDNPNGPAVLRFQSPVRLVAGDTYHLVYVNSNPPTGACATWPVSNSQARNCPRNQGAHGLNGVYFGPHGGDGPRYGPFRGSADANLSRRYAGSGWQTDVDKLSWYRLIYSDGVETGDTVLAHGSYEAPQLQIVGGSKQVRQVFTVRDASRDVDGVWLSYGHLAGSNPSGAPLSVKVKNEAGDVLATGSLPYSAGCASKPSTSNVFQKFCQDWFYTDLSSVVSLEQGNTYSVELSAPNSAAFAFGVTFPGIYSPIDSESRTHWGDAYAQVSSNGGSSWSSWSSGYQGERDMALVFTTNGGPRELE